MAKNKISEFSSTAANNTDVSNINIAEGCSPSNVNNAIRSVMAQLKDFQSANPTYYTADSDALAVGAGGTGAITATTARANLSAAKSGANSDITSLTGLTTALSVAQGGTGGTTASAAKTALSAASSGANSDITSLTGLTTALSVAQGGTGSTALTSGSVVVGNGTSAVSLVAPSTSGNVLTSNGTTWTSASPSITRATALTPTSGTSVSFTSIPSWVRRITVLFDGLTASASVPLIQIGAGSTTNTGYKSSSFNINTSISGSGVTSTAGYNVNVTFSTGLKGSMVISNISGNTWISYHSASDNDVDRVLQGNGIVTLGGTLDRVIITSVTGTATFSAGTVNILYE